VLCVFSDSEGTPVMSTTLTDEQLRTLSKLPKSARVLTSCDLGPIVHVETHQRTYLVNRAGYLISPRGSVRDVLLRAQGERNAT
jgi:hypothetical protein